MTEIIPNGSLVEVIEREDEAYGGQKFYVEDYAPFNEDPDYYSEVYTGTDGQGSWVAAKKDNVKLLLTPEQLRARKLPDAKTLLREFDFLGGFSDYQFNESDITEDDTIEVYGETPEGLRFGVSLKVTAIFPVDF